MLHERISRFQQYVIDDSLHQQGPHLMYDATYPFHRRYEQAIHLHTWSLSP